MTKRQLTPLEQVDLSNLAFTLAHDPATRPLFAQMVAQKFPERAASFSDVALRNEINALRREREQDKLIADAKDFQRAQDKQRDELVSSGRYTKDQAAEIKAVMDKNGILDYNIGAVLYAHETTPTQTQGGPPRDQRPGATWEFPTIAGRDGKPLTFADFVKNPHAASLDAAYQTIDGFGQRRLAR